MAKADILIVEDSFIVSFHLQTTLEGDGYRVIGTCESGEKALEFLDNHKPDLVLMDIMLNGVLDGIETASLVKQRYFLPVIYITALTDKDTIHRAKVTEPYGYLTKPFEDREIFTVIEMALYKHSIESRLRETEEKYFSTVKSISDAVVVMDRDFCVNYLNPSAEIVSGWLLSEAKGKSIFDIFRLRDSITDDFPVNPIQCVITPAKTNALPNNLLLYARHGEVKPIGEGSVSPVIDSKNNMTGLVIVFKDITDKVAHERLIKDFENRRLAALLEGQETERSRIAKDLHDGLGQMLNAIKMNLHTVIQNQESARDLYKLLDEAIQESIRISENLLPSKLKNFDLATCLKSLCSQVQGISKLTISFDSLGAPQDLDQLQKINFYRIAQEALNNAIKHSKAKSISVQLSEESSKVQLIIEDDGVGIMQSKNVPSKSAQNGLLNMRERAEIMGGKLILESDENRGTLIIVEAPVSK